MVLHIRGSIWGKSGVGFAVAFAGIAAAQLPPAAALPDAKVSLYQVSKTVVAKDNQTQTVIRKVWIKQPGRVRMDESAGALTKVTVSDGANLWVALPAQKKGIHRKLTAAESKDLASKLKVDVDALPKFVKAGAKKTRQEKVNGVLCNVYQRTTPEQMTFTLWVPASGPHLAQKQETSGIVRAADAAGQPMKTHIIKSTTDYITWQIDKPIPDSIFSAPTGVKYDEYKRPTRPIPGAFPRTK